VIAVASIMIPDQIRVIVPLLEEIEDVRVLFENIGFDFFLGFVFLMVVLESSECFQVALKMLDAAQKEALSSLATKDLAVFERRSKDLKEKVDRVERKIKEVQAKIEAFCASKPDASNEQYLSLKNEISNAKERIEKYQKENRGFVAKIKLVLSFAKEEGWIELERSYKKVNAEFLEYG